MDLQRDLTVDFTNVDDDGLTHASIRDANDPSRVVTGAHLVVGDDDAEPAVARVIDVKSDTHIVLLRVLPGPARQHLHLVGPSRAAG